MTADSGQQAKGIRQQAPGIGHRAMTGPRTTKPRTTKPRMTKHQMTKHQMTKHQSNKTPKRQNCEATKHRMTGLG